MPPQTPIGTTTVDVPQLGTIKGLLFQDGTSQFCGIPYANLAKRWSRSTLKKDLPDGFHDGTQHGPISPQPPELVGIEDPMVPVPPFPHFQEPTEDEFNGLNLTVVGPSRTEGQSYPVMVWIHGGGFLFGSSTHPTYDTVNLVSFASKKGSPVVIVSLNYRVGLFGFMASQAIKEDLSRDGFKGVGNFGLTDQQTALDWVQEYISAFGGDPNNVTVFGESAGGMSVAHQIWAREPRVFHRGISMSGTLNSLTVLPLEKHEKRWNALLKYFDIGEQDPDALEKLRAIPQQTLAAATCAFEGTDPMPNPCDDGWFHSNSPSISTITTPPEWLQAYITGDTKDEGLIFRGLLEDENYTSIKEKLAKYLGHDKAKFILDIYDMHPDIPEEKLRLLFEEMIGDIGLKIPSRLHAQASTIPRTFGYHFDQLSTLDNPLKGFAYHAIDLLYVFLNFTESMSDGQQRLAHKVAGDFIDFAHGKDPWERYSVSNRWMVYGPDNEFTLKSEKEDNEVRRYDRWEAAMAAVDVDKWGEAVDYIANKRFLLDSSE